MDSTAEDPIARFEAWMAEAAKTEPNDANAVCLATATPEGRPSARMVLLKGVDRDRPGGGFVFYTNLESRKGGELLANRFAALCFHWKTLQRSVRVEGPVEPVSEADADAYYASRARGSRIGAWASRQSRPLEGRWALEKAVAEYTMKFGIGEIPRPPFWSGFRVLPQRIEFWRDMPFRLHDRQVFHREGAGWRIEALYP
ncbi:pyridoxamine 5'-phosphate oxidase [Paracraurococcus lichenis]|uniref:Pyridoxine/pyridoxamine 5'-phosphate oxidase n=1 Tax=Paracraurococcus lichenis TaxID=3064888 RepID=A0ABT9E1U6_9PROT|nr:pyridoxamine 5'-phosphate oxidase [Paracraurococcus sp. LOR1-02]MDO9710116.1 pyridoxamine 5'-phosphate oxidase [Paracraurococcus sp. LOR1-02]